MTEEAKAPGGQPDDTVKMTADQIIKRRSRWSSSLAAIRYVDSISRDHQVKLRDTDRATSLALLVTCVFATLSLFVPQLSQHRIPLTLAADVLVGLSILTHVANRMGIVTTLTPRQALLVWQLILGSCLIGAFMTINLLLIITQVVGHTKVVIPQ